MVIKIINEKGFQLVNLELADMQKIGLLGICDFCDRQIKSGTFIGFLNKVYCKTCFADWDRRAVFFHQVSSIEARVTDRLLVLLNAESLILSHKNVGDTFAYCLWKDGEIEEKTASQPIIGNGVRTNVNFHPKRLKESTYKIESMLNGLPDGFKKSVGGGISFLNMCMDKNNVHWTGLHQKMDELVMLGNAIGKVEFLFPKHQWSSLPGGMPYIVIL